MHLVHKEKKTGALGAVLGIMFAVEESGNHANDFIESLNIDRAHDPENHHILDENFNDGYYET